MTGVRFEDIYPDRDGRDDDLQTQLRQALASYLTDHELTIISTSLLDSVIAVVNARDQGSLDLEQALVRLQTEVGSWESKRERLIAARSQPGQDDA